MKSTDSWDIFICHSSDDKDEVAEPLADLMNKMGVRTFYDRWSIPKTAVVDERVDMALENSKIGVVVYSDNFFESPYSISERRDFYKGKLQNLTNVFPIFYNIKPDDIRIIKLPHYKNFNGSIIHGKKDSFNVAVEIIKVVIEIKEEEILNLKGQISRKQKLIWLFSTIIILGCSIFLFSKISLEKKDLKNAGKDSQNGTDVSNSNVESSNTFHLGDHNKVDSLRLNQNNSNINEADAGNNNTVKNITVTQGGK